MPDIEGTTVIKIQPRTLHLPVSLQLSVCSSPTANDGQIPYGDELESAEVKAYAPDGDDVTSQLVTQSPSITGNLILCELSYYEGIALGRHTLIWIYTCKSGYRDEVRATRVLVNT